MILKNTSELHWSQTTSSELHSTAISNLEQASLRQNSQIYK